MPAAKLMTFEQAIAAEENPKKRHVLLGNGFSRAWKENVFSYRALLEEADFKELSPVAQQAFAALDTTDFEAVMRGLRTAARLVELYAPTRKRLAKRLKKDARLLREVLVRAIAGNHPSRPNAVSKTEYEHARTFLSNFEHIYTLNYDLLLHWALMQSELQPQVTCDDGFRTPDAGEREYVTWEVEKTDGQDVFFLHGALHMFDAGHETQKYTWTNTGIALMDQIRAALSDEKFPLFVSEGESHQKLAKIKHSDILSRAYRSFPKITGSLYVHGHSMNANDEHIIRLISRGRCSQLYVSVFGDPKSPPNLAIVKRADALMGERPTQRPLSVRYYDAETARVWRG